MVELQVGEFYLSASGEIVKIEYKERDLYYDTSDNYYEYGGTCVGSIREFDLIAEIPKELHWYILKRINQYYTNNYYKKDIDNLFNERVTK